MRASDVVVHGLDFEVRSGELVAVVGPSGGRSTLLQLFVALYDVRAGRTLLDGIDVATLDPADLRRQFALVPQDPAIFSGSIGENIHFARPEASLDEVQQAAIMSAADCFITALPQG